MSRDAEFEQKIEILSQHLGVVTQLLETLILRLNYDGTYPATSILRDVEALHSQSKDASRSQMFGQIARALRDADSWQPPVRSE